MFDRPKAYRGITRGVLVEYLLMKGMLVSIPQRIATEQARLTGIRSASAEMSVVSGGGCNVRQERDIAIIAEIDRLKNELEVAQKDVACIEFALSQLDEKERRVLELKEIQKQHGAIDRLCIEFGYERTKVYDIYNTALGKFSKLYNGAK